METLPRVGRWSELFTIAEASMVEVLLGWWWKLVRVGRSRGRGNGMEGDSR